MVSMVCAAFHGHFSRRRSMISSKRPKARIFARFAYEALDIHIGGRSRPRRPERGSHPPLPDRQRPPRPHRRPVPQGGRTEGPPLPPLPHRRPRPLRLPGVRRRVLRPGFLRGPERTEKRPGRLCRLYPHAPVRVAGDVPQRRAPVRCRDGAGFRACRRDRLPRHLRGLLGRSPRGGPPENRRRQSERSLLLWRTHPRGPVPSGTRRR